MKPIEPGCLALFHGHFETATVRCIRPISRSAAEDMALEVFGIPVYALETSQHWEVDPPVTARFVGRGERFAKLACAAEAYLTRIDGYDESTQDSEPVPVELERV